MDLQKKYKTSEDIECNILQLVKMEPEWAANMIQHYEQKLTEATSEVNVEAGVRWQQLQDKILKQIDIVDNGTVWQESEPDWWIEMMEVRRLVQKQVSDNSSD